MTFSRIVAGYFYLILDSNKKNVIYPSFHCSDLETIGVSYLTTVRLETLGQHLPFRKAGGETWAQGQRREVSHFATPRLAHMNILYSLEVSSLLLVWILPCSLEKPTPAFIGQLSGRKALSSTGTKERSSCYLPGTSPLPGQLLVPILTRDVMVRRKPLTGSVFWGKLLNLCTLVSSSDTLTVALWAESPKPGAPS